MLLLLGKRLLGSALTAGAETRTRQANRALEELARAFTELAPGDLRFEELAGMNDGGALPATERGRYRRLVLARAAKRRELEWMPLQRRDPRLLLHQPDLNTVVPARGRRRG
ncbi:hypothetical protein [Arthrobacter sp. CG_A4]|uniref:hypothetical protein n=1 Tax=Arthrobacter sp. CG_A4 TaxID=3071706 RepID=UPI002E004243|nr:hypothetical protein [Arthrobacter sp. CG_A4]